MSDKTFPFLKFHRTLPREVPVPVRVLGFGEIHEGFVNGDAGDQAARCIDCGNPYCSWGCPLGNRIPQWLKLVQDGRIEDAASLMHETNPLPEICGRVCPQDRLCEGVCTLEDTNFGAVTIGAIERWTTDTAIARGWRPAAAEPSTGRRVAIVGAGPAGLAAADRLARAGTAVVVFDRYEEIGGLLTFGIPAFKLDKEIVRTRRRLLEELGVRFRLNCEVGRDLGFASLLQEFDAVFLGTGAYTEVEGNLPGSDFGGVQRALPFLIANARRLLGGTQSTDALPDLAGKRVVVLGGGDTAMDCVRSSIRLGAEEVRCVYRRDEANMPGSRREVKYAKDEGVQFLFNRQPLEIIGDAGNVRGVRVATTQLVADGSGRARPQMVAGSEETIAADAVLLAFGFQPSPAPWFAEFGMAMHSNGRLRIGENALPYQTSNPKVFAGGDNVRGADLVVRAVLDGRDAAEAMLRHLATLPASTAVCVAA